MTDDSIDAASEHILRELKDGVQHGFFRMEVTVEVIPAKKKCITVRSGKSYRFVIST
jgi:hypothetical protein